MSGKKETIKVGISVAHSASSSHQIAEPKRFSLLSQIVSILSVKLNKLDEFKEILEEVTIPASLLLSLTIPFLLLSASGGGFVFIWFAILIIVSGVVSGVLLYRYRARIAQPSISIASQIPPSQ
jgi:hypothetical protein